MARLLSLPLCSTGEAHHRLRRLRRYNRVLSRPGPDRGLPSDHHRKPSGPGVKDSRPGFSERLVESRRGYSGAWVGAQGSKGEKKTMATNGNTDKLFGKFNSIEIAWLAGLLEGEGCFPLNRKASGRCDARIQLNMTDEDVVRRAAKMLGRSVYMAQRAGQKPQWYVRTTGTKAISWMMTIYGLMGKRRQERIRGLLAHWKAQPVPYNKRGTCPRGHPYDKEYRSSNGFRVRRHRICVRCTRAQARRRYLLSRPGSQLPIPAPQ